MKASLHRLAAVEDARKLMAEAKDWSVWQWLLESRRVRAIVAAATAALEKAEKRVKADWPDPVKKVYRQLEARIPVDLSDPLHSAVAEVKQADDDAYDARTNSEALFDEAERRRSAPMVREGAQKTIEALGLHERAIHQAEAVARHKTRPYSL